MADLHLLFRAGRTKLDGERIEFARPLAFIARRRADRYARNRAAGCPWPPGAIRPTRGRHVALSMLLVGTGDSVRTLGYYGRHLDPGV